MEASGRQRYHRAMKPLLLLFAAAAAAPAVQSAETLPASILHVPGHVGDVFVADTSTARISHYRNEGEGLRPAGESYFSIGENGVGKERAWDRKTPLGVYFVTEQLDTSRLPDKYGVTAFPLDYPNVLDRHAGRTGDGIWVHGVGPGVDARPFRDTDGCLALPNDELSAREENFVPGETPVVITRRVKPLDEVRRQRIVATLMAKIEAWRETLAHADVEKHLELYAPGFTYRGLDRRAWLAMRRDAMESAGPRVISISEPLILADPELDGLYLARFSVTTAGAETLPLIKRLYWQRDAAGRLTIVAEDTG
jgi:murein L,D-transpeptidase YafK